MWKLHESNFSDNWEKTPSLLSSFTGYKQNRVRSDPPTYIDIYTFHGSDEKLLKISERVDNFNVWEESSYLVIRDSNTQTVGFLFKDGYEFERVSVIFTEKELVISQESLIEDSPLLSNEEYMSSTKNQNNYLLHLNYEKGEREDNLFQAWSYILTVNISSILFLFVILFKKMETSFSYDDRTELPSLWI